MRDLVAGARLDYTIPALEVAFFLLSCLPPTSLSGKGREKEADEKNPDSLCEGFEARGLPAQSY